MEELDPDELTVHPGLPRVVAWVAALNAGYFGIEFAVALAIGSVSLFADSVDFLEDAAVNLLVLLALGWPVRQRAVVGGVLGLMLLAPSVGTLWTAWQKVAAPVAPSALPLVLAGLGALVINVGCAWMLLRWREARGSLTRGAFLSARNDAIANVAIVAAGVVTAFHPTPWPDLAVGLGIFVMNLNATREIWEAAHKEFHASTPRALTGEV
jgi:Co/Zn/Cd efflux system component